MHLKCVRSVVRMSVDYCSLSYDGVFETSCQYRILASSGCRLMRSSYALCAGSSGLLVGFASRNRFETGVGDDRANGDFAFGMLRWRVPSRHGFGVHSWLRYRPVRRVGVAEPCSGRRVRINSAKLVSGDSLADPISQFVVLFGIRPLLNVISYAGLDSLTSHRLTAFGSEDNERHCRVILANGF